MFDVLDAERSNRLLLPLISGSHLLGKPMLAHCPRAHSSRRLVIAMVICLGMICAAMSFNPGRAEASTIVSSNITSNTTWTTAGSPYLLDSQVSVAAGVTLTIQPGVTVEFNSTSPGLTFFILGAIKSIGTKAKPITFTSAQGAAGHGAPGQYEGVNVQAGASSQFSYTNFYYGGSGSGGYYAYGALEIPNQGTQVSISHSVFEDNEYSGLQIGDGVVSVTSSTFEYNGDGISQEVIHSPGQLKLSDSTISHNVQDGLFFNVLNGLSTPGSTVNNNLITANGSNGIQIDMYCSTPTTSFPHGNQNDIYANGDTSDPSDGTELYTNNPCHATSVDWTGNYWGNVTWYTGPTALASPLSCDGDGPPEDWFQSDPSVQPNGYLGYTPWIDPKEPPPGPISTGESQVFVPFTCPNGDAGTLTYDEVYNSFYLQPGQISTSYIPIP